MWTLQWSRRNQGTHNPKLSETKDSTENINTQIRSRRMAWETTIAGPWSKLTSCYLKTSKTRTSHWLQMEWSPGWQGICNIALVVIRVNTISSRESTAITMPLVYYSFASHCDIQCIWIAYQTMGLWSPKYRNRCRQMGSDNMCSRLALSQIYVGLDILTASHVVLVFQKSKKYVDNAWRGKRV